MNHPCIVRLCNQKGDETVATFDPKVEKTCEVAQDALTAFLDKCITEHGSEPPVWARRIGESDFGPFDGRHDDLTEVDDVMLQYPLVGG